MKSRVLDRIKRLEQRPELAEPMVFQYGWLKPLPEDHVGERHVVIVKREPTASPRFEWCRVEERPGAAPPTLDDPHLTLNLTQ